MRGTTAPQASPNPLGSASGLARRALVLALVLLVAGGAALALGERLSWPALAEHEQALRTWTEAQPGLALAAAFVLYVGVTGLSLPGAAALTLLYGWLFGLVRGLVLVSCASTTGAVIAFLLSRYLFRELVQARFGAQFATFDAAIAREGAFYLFTLRLIPQVPFFVINVVLGLTPIRLRTFWWVSQLGMLPGTCLYVWAGSRLPGLGQVARDGVASAVDARLLIALAALGLFPLAGRLIIRWLRRARPSAPSS